MGLDKLFGIGIAMSVVDKVSGPMRNIGASMGATERKSRALRASMMKVGAGMAIAGGAMVGFAVKTIMSTTETQTALGELASLGVKDLGAIEDAAKGFSNQWSGTTKSEFISAAYDIRSGIASLSDEAVGQFTGIAALTAKATKASVADMTSMFASGYGIYKNFYGDLSDFEFAEMFSGGIAGAVQQFKTTGPGMSQAISTLGASATTANVPLEEQLAILGMLQATMPGAEAGTKYKAFLKSAVKGGQALGLTFVDANNQLLAMPDILDKLRGKFGSTIDAMERLEMQKAFGRIEALEAVELLITKTDDLRGNIRGLSGDMADGTEKTREMADAMDKGLGEKWDKMNQRLDNLMEELGKPNVADAGGRLDWISEKFLGGQGWVGDHPTAGKWIADLGFVVGVLGVGITLLGWMGPSFATGIGIITTAVGFLGTALAFVTAEIGLFAAAVVSSPLLGAGIAALLGSWLIYDAITNKRGHTTKVAEVTGMSAIEKTMRIPELAAVGGGTLTLPERYVGYGPAQPTGTIDAWVTRPPAITSAPPGGGVTLPTRVAVPALPDLRALATRALVADSLVMIPRREVLVAEGAVQINVNGEPSGVIEEIAEQVEEALRKILGN